MSLLSNIHEMEVEIDRLRRDRDSLESTVDSLRQEIKRLRGQLVKTRTALDLLWKETVASGNHVANDYGWPKAREATLAALSLTDDLGK